MKDDGFAMADAIISLMIASVFITSILGINAASLKAAESGNEKITATLIAKAILEDRSLRENSGTFVIAGKSYSWTRHTTPRSVAHSDVLAVDDIELSIVWASRHQAKSLNISTAKYRVNAS